MAIQWGAWEYGGGNGMRVGIDVSWSEASGAPIDHGSVYALATVKIYTENQYTYNDPQVLSYGGSISGSTSYTNSGGAGKVTLRATKTYQYTYGSSEYGSSPGSRTFSATLSGAYNGVTPSKSVTSNIPARPYAAPAAPGVPSVARVSDTSHTISWSRNSTAGEPYQTQYISRWDNVSGAWGSEVSLSGSATSYSSTSQVAGRNYRWRVRAANSAGTSNNAYSEYSQTSPAAPSGASVVKASTTSVTVSWKNNQSGTNYDYTTEIEESLNGGAFTLVNTAAEGVASYSRTGLTPGAIYQYRVRAKSTVDATTYSGYSTTSTIQLQAPPAAPTGFTASRTSDTSMSLAWTNNPTTDAPYETLTVQRWDSVSNTWTTVASLSPTATSLVDTATVANRKYQYRIRSGNAAGSSDWATSGFIYTTPAAPSNAEAEYSGGTTITASWVNNASYAEHTITVTPYKNGVAQTPVTVSSGEVSYDLTGIDVLASYYFKVKAVSTVGSLSSTEAQSNTVMGAAAPNAPVNLAPTGVVSDLNKATTLTWLHSPSQDGSKQKKFEVQHRIAGGSWTSSGTITSATSSWTLPAGTYANGQVIEWQVRTWGVYTSPGPWSTTATITGSTTPTLTLNTPGATIPLSVIEVDWDYFDAESTPQAQWELTLYDETGLIVLEQQAGTDDTSNLTLNTAASDGESYQLTVRVRDGSGLWSDLLTQAFTADFIPPAEVLLDATLDDSSGSVVLSLTPTPDDGGVTTLPATSVTIERQIYDPETETYGDWEIVVENIDPNVTVVDTTAPINDDGHYRITTFSAAPSSYKPTTKVVPNVPENKWIYVSGGRNFDVVCRFWANPDIQWKASRTKALHYFAGRGKPVLYSGEQKDKVLTVTGLLTSDASNAAQWMRLAQEPGAVLLRAPGNRRIFGALSEVSIDRIDQNLSKVSFSITEVFK